MPQEPLHSKVVLITGACSEMGRNLAIVFAANGSKLALSGEDEAALQATADACKGAPDILTVPGDLTVEENVERLIERTMNHYKQIDSLINCLETIQTGGIERTSLEQYDTVMKMNLRSVYHLVMLTVPHLASTKGTIVNVSSIASLRVFPDMLSYSMSKAAMDQLTKCLALELAPKQIRVNSVNHGDIFANSSHKNKGKTGQDHPLNRKEDPLDIGKSVYCFACEHGGAITGVQFAIDGGRHLQ